MVEAQMDKEKFNRIKAIMIAALNKSDLKACIKIISKGFPIDNPIMDNGVNILMYIAMNKSAAMLSQFLQSNPDVNA